MNLFNIRAVLLLYKQCSLVVWPTFSVFNILSLIDEITILSKQTNKQREVEHWYAQKALTERNREGQRDRIGQMVFF